jgi:hypothetical protein
MLVHEADAGAAAPSARPLRVLFALFACSLVSSATAAGEVELTPIAGFRFDAHLGSPEAEPTLDVELDQGAVYGLTIDVSFDSETWLELWYSRQSTSVVEDTGLLAPAGETFEIDVDHLHVGGIRQYTESPTLAAFFSFTGGVTRLDPPAGFDSETRFSASIGAGIKWKPLRRLGLRLHGRWIPTLVDSSSEVFCGENRCLVSIEGSLINQFELGVGIIFRLGDEGY